MKIASNVIWVGTSMGTMLLLVRWITGNALLSSEQSLVKFGILFAMKSNETGLAWFEMELSNYLAGSLHCLRR